MRFEVTADEASPQENVTIEARSGSDAATESLLVVSSGSLHLRVPQNLTAKPGSPVRFTTDAIDDQGLPVSLVVASKPDNATFDAASGLFEWTPADRDLGLTGISFIATNSLGLTQAKTVNIRVVSQRPFLSGLRNGAGSGAVAACSPGALAALIGTSLGAARSEDTIRVLVNGADALVVRTSDERVEFLCPSLAAGTPLAISVAAGDQVSNEVRTVMVKTAPGLFSVDGSGVGVGMILHAHGLAALPRFDRAGMPVSAGDTITLFATGIDCAEISDAPRPFLHFEHDYQQITLLRPSAFPGVCEIHSVVPGGITGNEVKVSIESVREDGTAVRSNTILVAVE